MCQQPNFKNFLITSNVFHNGLGKHNVPWSYYAEQFLKLIGIEGINWYISELDFILAFEIPERLGLLGDKTCQKACLNIREKLKICPVDQEILEEARFYNLNFFDSIRLACAIDRNLDGIVTWEPELFSQNLEDSQQIQKENHGLIKTRAVHDEDNQLTYERIWVFGVSRFLLCLDDFSNGDLLKDKQQLTKFVLEKVEVIIGEKITATIIIRNFEEDSTQETAEGNSPIDALQKAIDRGINKYVLIPERHLSYFHIPATILQGADGIVEVVIRTECGNLSFEKSSENQNIFQAAGDAYIKTINSICDYYSDTSISIS
ncbi:hypothetical protein I4641_20595 [Waterburya agarophytonicola K14]|uniref:2-isopropylmalate synthase LeuA allosteric (dimerisation) domain-containing protein n=1 Tax=Waterburya agarophytonicola KI4 TaxID=2874699 RepID=A0A964BUE0_9CYAN|nr:alpha-isopropylmalate synthase regulatory domain-containing protein [Waterburya agarophytonicola]MCC0179364.1 hypothetical protein [Waterburya agarophytonicola KI4]